MADKEANKLVAMLVEISNTGTVAFDVGQDWFRLQDMQDFVYTWTYTNQQTKPELYFVTVNPGQKVNGYMIYQIPEAAQPKAGLCRPSSGTRDSPQLIWSE